MTPNHVKLQTRKMLYLAWFAAGLEESEILERIPSAVKGKIGIHENTLKNWRTHDPAFREAELNIMADPRWFRRELGIPMELAALQARDVEYILGHAEGRAYKGTGGKQRELLLQEAGLIGQTEDPAERTRRWLEGLKFTEPKIIIEQPAEVPVSTTKPALLLEES